MSNVSQALSASDGHFDVVKQRWSGFFKSPLDWVFVSGLVGLAPLIYVEAKSLWYLKHYQFFPLAWAAFVAIVVLRGGLATTRGSRRVLFGRTVLIGAFLLTLMAAALNYPKIAQVAGIGLCVGWMMLRLGKNPWYECIAWSFLLLITVRLPVTMDQQLIHRLQAQSSQSASALLDLTGIPHLATGNVIEIRPGKLFVEEACSGVDSFYALGAVAIMLAIWQQRGLLVSLLTIASVPLWAWFGNVLRLYVLTILYNNWDINLTEGWQHTALGLFIFALAFGGLLSMQEAFTRLFSPLHSSDANADWAHRFYNWLVTWPDDEPPRVDESLPAEPVAVAGVGGGDTPAIAAPRPKSKALGLVLPVTAVVAFLVCGVVTAGPVLGIGSNRANRSPGFDRGAVVATFSAEDLPRIFRACSARNSKCPIASGAACSAHSATWAFQDRGREVVVSLDFAFTVFHPLEVCYISTGSQLIGDVLQYDQVTDIGPVHVNSVQLLDLFGDQSYLIYTEFTDEGVSAERAEVFSLNALFNKGLFRKSLGPLFQLQILVSDASALTEEDRERYRNILVKAKQTLLPKVQQLTGIRPASPVTEEGA